MMPFKIMFWVSVILMEIAVFISPSLNLSDKFFWAGILGFLVSLLLIFLESERERMEES